VAGGANYNLDKGYKSAAAIGSAASGPDLATSYDYFLAVKASGTAGDTVTPVTAVTDTVLGFSQQRVVTADINKQVVDIRMLGITKAVAGAAVTFGAFVKHNATGRVVSTATATDRVLGIALTAAAADGDVIDVLLTPAGQVGAGT
jgi:Uncharacterized conserved protein (DUF2190)